MFVKSSNIDVFPCSKSRTEAGKGSNNLLLENNIASLIDSLVDVDSFIVKPTNTAYSTTTGFASDVIFSIKGRLFCTKKGTCIGTNGFVGLIIDNKTNEIYGQDEYNNSEFIYKGLIFHSSSDFNNVTVYDNKEVSELLAIEIEPGVKKYTLYTLQLLKASSTELNSEKFIKFKSSSLNITKVCSFNSQDINFFKVSSM